MDIEEMKKRMGQKEPLHKDLQPYLGYTDMGFPMLKHPLVFNLFHTEHDNARMNMFYEHKLESLKRAKQKKDYGSYIFLHERPYRLNAFLDIMDKVNDKQYWQLLGEVWIDSENIWQSKSVWKELLTDDRDHREYFMTKEDRKVFAELPEKLTIYRGYVEKMNKNGFSYTLDYDKAEWFSNRFGKKNAGVIKKNINKKDAFAYMGGRNESEIIYLK